MPHNLKTCEIFADEIKRTDKAICYETTKGIIWLPISLLIEDKGNGEITVPEWWAIEKDLI